MNTLKLTYIFLLFNFTLLAQDGNMKWRFSTDPTHLLVNNFGIKTERQIKNKTLGLYIGVKVASKQTAKLSGGNHIGSGYTFGNFNNPVNNGITVGLNNKYYVKDPVIGYIDFNIFYRHWWINDKYVEFKSRESIKGVRRERQDIYGFKFLVGETFPFCKHGKYRPYIDAAVGLGVRLKRGTFETFDCEINGQTIKYSRHVLEEWWPSVHIGITFGIVTFGTKQTQSK